MTDEVKAEAVQEETKSVETADIKKAEQSVSQEDFNRIYAELKSTKEKLTSRISAEETAKQKALEEQGKFKELFESTTKELESLKGRIDAQKKSSAIREAGYELGIAKVDYLRLIDSDRVVVNDDGTSNAKELVETLKKSDPALFNTYEKQEETKPNVNGAKPASKLTDASAFDIKSMADLMAKGHVYQKEFKDRYPDRYKELMANTVPKY